MFGFSCVHKNVEGRLQIYTFILVYSQIWQNLPRDDCHLKKNFLWMIITQNCITRFLQKNTD